MCCLGSAHRRCHRICSEYCRCVNVDCHCLCSIWLQQPHLALGRSQLFSTAAGSASAAGSSAAPGGSSSLSSTCSPEKRTLYVQVFGQPGLAEIEISSDATVARLGKQIINELKLDVSPSAVLLHLSTATKLEGIGKELGEPLDPRHNLHTAKVGNGACIVVKVAGVTPTASPADIAGACGGVSSCLQSGGVSSCFCVSPRFTAARWLSASDWLGAPSLPP